MSTKVRKPDNISAAIKSKFQKINPLCNWHITCRLENVKIYLPQKYYICIFVFLTLLIDICTNCLTARAESANYFLEDVAGIWQQDYTLNGPALGALFAGDGTAIDIDSNENIFVMDLGRVRVISNGRVWTVAGNGIRGFMDGPADSAMFDTGGRGYDYNSLALDSQGRIYVADGNNNRLRRVYMQQDGTWWVETFAGGGATVLQPGQIAPANNISIYDPVSVTVDIFDNVWTEGAQCIYKITPSGNAYCYNNSIGNVVRMKADKVGNVYALLRYIGPSNYWQISQDGTAQRIAGVTDTEWNQEQSLGKMLVDGPALQASFWNNGTFGVTSDGSTIYGGGGGELVVRRIQAGQTMTLFKGEWQTSTMLNSGWFLGGPLLVDDQGRIYLHGTNPPAFLWFRRLVPIVP